LGPKNASKTIFCPEISHNYLAFKEIVWSDPKIYKEIVWSDPKI